MELFALQVLIEIFQAVLLQLEVLDVKIAMAEKRVKTQETLQQQVILLAQPAIIALLDQKLKDLQQLDAQLVLDVELAQQHLPFVEQVHIKTKSVKMCVSLVLLGISASQTQ